MKLPGERKLEALEFDGIAANFRMIMVLETPNLPAYHSALEEIERGLSAAPGIARLHALRGKALSNLSCFAEACESLGRALALDAGDARARAWLGEAYLLENRIDAAISALDRALVDDPAGAWARFYRAAARYVAGQPEPAREDLLAVLGGSSAPAAKAAAKAFLGLLEAQAGHHEEALALIESARAAGPSAAWLFVLRASVHRLRGDRPAALADLGAALAQRPVGWLHLERALLYEEAGKTDLALASISAALRLDAPSGLVYLRRARIRLARKELGLAAVDYNRALTLGCGADIRSFALQLGEAYLHSGRRKEAGKVLGLAAARFPGDGEVLLLLAQSMRSETAAAFLLDGLLGRGASKSTDPRVHQALGAAHESAGRPTAAVAAYRKACSLRPYRLTAFFQLARLLLVRDDGRGAARALAAAKRRSAVVEDAGIETLIDHFQISVCLLDNEGAARIGELILDQTRRFAHLEALSVPIKPGYDGAAITPALRRYTDRGVAAAEVYARRHPDSAWGVFIVNLWRPHEAAPEECRSLMALPASRYGWMRERAGSALLYRREFAEAIRQLSVARDFSEPRNWRCQCFLAEERFFQGDLNGALRAFRELKRWPEAPRGEVLAWKAAILLWGGRYRQALKVLEALPKDEESPYALCWKGAALYKLGRYGPALAALDESLAGSPNDREARVWRAEALLRHGQARAALKAADEAVNLGGAADYAHAVRGLSRAAAGDGAGLCADFLKVGKPLLEGAARALGLAGIDPRDAAPILETVLEMSCGIRRSDLTYTVWAGRATEPFPVRSMR